jgi:hypothetical protein
MVTSAITSLIYFRCSIYGHFNAARNEYGPFIVGRWREDSAGDDVGIGGRSAVGGNYTDDVLAALYSSITIIQPAARCMHIG